MGVQRTGSAPRRDGGETESGRCPLPPGHSKGCWASALLALVGATGCARGLLPEAHVAGQLIHWQRQGVSERARTPSAWRFRRWHVGLTAMLSWPSGDQPLPESNGAHAAVDGRGADGGTSPDGAGWSGCRSHRLCRWETRARGRTLASFGIADPGPGERDGGDFHRSERSGER